MPSEEFPLGRTGVPVDAWVRYRGHWLLRGDAVADPPSREEALVIFAQEPPTFPPGNPSLPMRPYQRGDAVAVNEVVLRSRVTGAMVVVYPGSKEAAEHPWPGWEQVYV